MNYIKNVYLEDDNHKLVIEVDDNLINLIKLFTKQMSNKKLIFRVNVRYNLLKKQEICVILYMGEILEIYKK